MTLSEHHARLKAEGRFDEYLARVKDRDARISALTEEYAVSEAPIVRDLRSAGADVTSVWDLVNSEKRYPDLIPILVAHLDRQYPERVREGIARALAVPESRSVWNTLVDRFIAEKDVTTHGVKWALHLAVAASSDLSVLDTLVRLAIDRRHGGNRAMFVDALARLDSPLASATLIELEKDPDLSGDVRRVLGRRAGHK